MIPSSMPSRLAALKAQASRTRGGIGLLLPALGSLCFLPILCFYLPTTPHHHFNLKGIHLSGTNSPIGGTSCATSSTHSLNLQQNSLSPGLWSTLALSDTRRTRRHQHIFGTNAAKVSNYVKDMIDVERVTTFYELEPVKTGLICR